MQSEWSRPDTNLVIQLRSMLSLRGQAKIQLPGPSTPYVEADMSNYRDKIL